MEPMTIKIIWASLIGFTALGIFSLILMAMIRDRDNRWDAINPEKAKPMYYHGSDITPTKGDFFVRVSEYQWINIFWDKEAKTLYIKRPPKTYIHNEKYPILTIETNWKVIEERQPKRVGLEYFVRQVM
jgi:hypothetical protein